MKLRLNLNHQHLLSPQLQQAIRLLQLSTIDLQQEIQNQIELNPLLEAIEDEPKIETAVKKDDEANDIQWANFYDAYDYSNEVHTSRPPTLKDHLLWQLELTPMTNLDKLIATTIIDAINDDGFLTADLTELQETFVRNGPRGQAAGIRGEDDGFRSKAELRGEVAGIRGEDDDGFRSKAELRGEAAGIRGEHQDIRADRVKIEDIEAVRHLVQRFDPIGCAAIDLKETLLIQLSTLKANPEIKIAKKLIEENLHLLAKHQYAQLCKIYAIDETTLNQILHLIKNLNPKPGSVINIATNDNIVPDLICKKMDNNWEVTLNQSALPHLTINRYYASLINQAKNVSDLQFLKGRLQEAQWFIKNVHNRQETLLKVARFIVNYQKNFFDFGSEAMKPLILHEVAQALNLHESTISRVTTQKYLHTPKGLYELKYFFSTHLKTNLGGKCSAKALQAIIKKIIMAENPQKPLSDYRITQLLNEQGIKIARRTVSKYRENLGIAAAHTRKLI